MVLSREILDRAAASMPTVLGTLDAIHLATALAFAESRRVSLTLLTHDTQLATGARALGLPVEGVAE